MGQTATRQYRDTQVDVKVVLAGLWIAMLMVYAYVDIFAFFRADVLEAALDGKVATTPFAVDQVFLVATLGYVLVPILMVVGSLLLPARINRIANVVVSLLVAVTVLGSCIGEEWVYYLAGSGVEVLLLVTIARVAWRWPAP